MPLRPFFVDYTILVGQKVTFYPWINSDYTLPVENPILLRNSLFDT